MLSLAKNAFAATAVFIAVTAGPVGQTFVPLSALVGQTLLGQVVDVIDGDTLDVRLDSDREVRVRLAGIDAPAMGAPFSNDARNIARNLLFERIVVLHPTDVDRDNQLVARVIVDAHDASRELVRHGVACVYARDLADVALADAQWQARARHVGFWRFSHSRPAVCPQPIPRLAAN